MLRPCTYQVHEGDEGLALVSESLLDTVSTHAHPLISTLTVSPCKNAAVYSVFQLASFKLVERGSLF